MPSNALPTLSEPLRYLHTAIPLTPSLICLGALLDPQQHLAHHRKIAPACTCTMTQCRFGLIFDLVFRFNRGRAPTAEELIRMYLSNIGRKGGLATKGISTPEKRRASRANGKLGGRPRTKK